MYYNVIEYHKVLKSVCDKIYLNYKPILTFCPTQVVYLRAYIKNRFKKTPGPILKVGNELYKKYISDQSCLACFNTCAELNCEDLEALLVP